MNSNFRTLARNLRNSATGIAGKVAAGTTALVASGAAMAQATSPGGAIASELSGGKSEVMLVIAAAAVIIGVLVLWAYVKRAK